MELVENTGLYNSDGVNTFATGAFAPGVTVSDVTYRMLAADARVKWRGLSVNAHEDAAREAQAWLDARYRAPMVS